MSAANSTPPIKSRKHPDTSPLKDSGCNYKIEIQTVMKIAAVLAAQPTLRNTTWTPKVGKITAQNRLKQAKGLLFYILLGSR